MRVPYTKTKYESKTLYGSLSLATNPPFLWMIAESTNKKDFQYFINFVKTKLIRGQRSKELNIVFDRHSSHTCDETRDWLAVKSRKVKPLIIPPSSSMFNSIETYFGRLKWHYKRLITKRRCTKPILRTVDITECMAESCAKMTPAS